MVDKKNHAQIDGQAIIITNDLQQKAISWK
jgi:hypothetical protein